MNWQDYIGVDPDVCHGKPCFKGTRIMVSLVLEMLEAHQTTDEILEAYPSLTLKHIEAALHLASELMENDRFFLFPAA